MKRARDRDRDRPTAVEVEHVLEALRILAQGVGVPQMIDLMEDELAHLKAGVEKDGS